jgi:micrococcal nuclease
MFLTRTYLILLLSLSLLTAEADAAETLPGPYAGAVERVVDGDTIAVRVTVWLGQELAVLVRVRGIDAPELRGDCDGEKARAIEATAALERLIGGQPVILSKIEGDKYFGRVLSDVATAGGTDVAAALIAAGLARPYDGGARLSWCEVGGLVDEREVARAPD